jgi:nucleolar protein 56
MRYVLERSSSFRSLVQLLTRNAQVFKVVLQPDTIGNRLSEVQKAVQDLDKFGKTVELVGLAPFQGTQDALQEINDISEGILSDFLRATLETNLPKAGKKKTITLGISEKNLASSIKSAFPNLSCETAETSEVVADLLRGLRQHSGKLIKKLQPGDIDRSILGLGHAYSRAKVKFSVNKQDNHIIQAIATLDQVDKDVSLAESCVRGTLTDSTTAEPVLHAPARELRMALP